MDATLPVPPRGAMLVVQAAGDPSVQMARVTQVVMAEPTMTAALLRLVNSAAYGIGKPVSTVQQAAMFLGTRAIRNIAVHHVVRTALAKADAGALDTRRFWEDCLRRAVLAQVLAKRAGYSDPSEAFTAGLLMDLGTLVLAVCDPARSHELQAVAHRIGSVRLAAEEREYGRGHPAAFVALGRAWGLPVDLLEVVEMHHNPTAVFADRERQRLLDILRVVDVIADVVQCNGMEGAMSRAADALEGLASREVLNFAELLDEVAAQMKKVAADLDMSIGSQPSWETLVTRASRAMMQMNENYEALTRRLEVAVSERDQAMEELVQANSRLFVMASTDVLTGVLSRRSFVDALRTSMEDQAQWPAALLMLDIDHFKAVNDTHGHAAGDDVLVEVARRFSSVLRAGDVIGRLGGEEFAVFLPNCPASEPARVAERVRQATRGTPITLRNGQSLSVTVSIGGVAQTIRPLSTDLWLSAADAALYQSKSDGRDRVSWAD